MMPRMNPVIASLRPPRWGCALIAFSDFSPITSATGPQRAGRIAQHPARNRDDAEHHRGRRAGFLGLDPHRVRWNRNLGEVVRGHCWERCRRNGVGSAGLGHGES